MIAGQRDPKALAQFARGRMRGKLTDLEEAFTGRFSDHHAFLLSKMLARIDAISADIADIDAAVARVEVRGTRYPEHLERTTGL